MQDFKSLLAHKAVPWIILGLWLLPPSFSRLLTGSWQTSGVVGDTFGIANSLFSGLALLGVVMTLGGQNEEMAKRDQQRLKDLEAMREQTLQLALATQLQSARALILERRKTLSELNPAIVNVPTSPSQLIRLRENTDTDQNTKIIPESVAEEIKQNIDELLALQIEITNIRNRLDGLYGVDKRNTEKNHGSN